MSFNPAACTSCGQPLRPNAQFCDACGASTHPAVRPVEVVRPVAPPPPRPSPLPFLAALAALAVLVAGIVLWRTRDRAPEPAPVAQRAERPPGMSSTPPEPADVGMSDMPDDVADEAGRDEVVEIPPDEPAPPPVPRVQPRLPPDPPVAREIVIAPPPPPPLGRTSAPPTAPPTRRDEPAEPPNRRELTRPASPPPAPEMYDGPLWDAYAAARANAESPGSKDPAVMRSEFCAAAARTLRDGQGRNVGRIRSDQRRFGC